MDRDNARAFINRMVDEEKKFIASLEEHKTSMENTEDWQNTMKNFAPTIKAFYNTQLESWSRFYLGLDSQSYNQGHGVMHLAPKKERSSMAPTIPHSVFGELKYKLKVGTADKLTASGAPAAREIMERKLGGEGQVIEAKGLGGKIGGADQQVYDGEEVTEPVPPAKKKPGSGPPTPEIASPASSGAAQGSPAPKKKVLPTAPKGDVPADENLAAILQRRKQMYSEGK